MTQYRGREAYLTPGLEGLHHQNERDGGLLYYRDGLNWQVLRVGTDGQFLKLASGLPSWATFALSDLPSGTHGDVLYANSSGVWTPLNAGTSGQFLQTQGGGANPQWATVSSGMVLLETETASNDATLDFTAFDNSTYASYLFVLANVVPASDDQDFWLRTSTDGGSNYDTTNAYSYVLEARAVGGSTTTAANAGDNQIKMTGNGAGSAAGEDGLSGHVWLYGPGLAKETQVTFDNAYTNAAGNLERAHGVGKRDSAADVDAVRFLFESGNVESGEIRMYGLVAA